MERETGFEYAQVLIVRIVVLKVFGIVSDIHAALPLGGGPLPPDTSAI